MTDDEVEKILKEDSHNILKWQNRLPNWANQWIKCSDRLPDKNAKYIVVFYGYEGWDSIAFSSFCVETQEFNHFNITHWMPIPEPPEDDE